MTVTTASGAFVVPPEQAVWVPGGVEHRIEAADQLEHTGDPRGFGLCEPHQRGTQRPIPGARGLGVVDQRASRLRVHPGRTEVSLCEQTPRRLCPLHVGSVGHRTGRGPGSDPEGPNPATDVSRAA